MHSEGLDSLLVDSNTTLTVNNVASDLTINPNPVSYHGTTEWHGSSGRMWTTSTAPDIFAGLNPLRPEQRQRRRRREREPEEPKRPLSRLSDEDYLALSARLHQEFEARLIENKRIARICHEADERDRQTGNRNFWRSHRQEYPDCDCERCRTYRGQTGEHDEDSLGW